MLDSQIPDNEWQSYLLKYKDQYQVKRDEINVCYIRCLKSAYGFVQLHSLEHKELAFIGSYKNGLGITALLSRLPDYCEVVQRGDNDVTIKFPESKLHELANPLRLYKRKKVSNAERERLREQIKKYGIHKRSFKKHKTPSNPQVKGKVLVDNSGAIYDDLHALLPMFCLNAHMVVS
jgi:hypothetical protein